MSLISILIPTLDSRADYLNRLIYELNKQIIDNNIPENKISIEILRDYQTNTIGFRRNILLRNSNSNYICFFDDDDLPTNSYIISIYNGALSGLDCASLKGIYTENGNNPELFEHSLRFSEWKTNYGIAYPGLKYERTPNHLNLIKREIASKVEYQDISFGEDKIWSDTIFNLNLLKTEYLIQEPIYNYLKVI
jgi:hypothetical protein